MPMLRLRSYLLPMMTSLVVSGNPSLSQVSPPPSSEQMPAPPPAKVPFPDGEANFQAALRTLQQNYLDRGLTTDDFYRAATQGLVEHIEPASNGWSRLLTPTELALELGNIRGRIVGVGVVIRYLADSGLGDIVGVVKGSAAAAGGVQVGDRLLSVDGHTWSSASEMYGALRGKPGTTVGVTLLRGTQLVALKLQRQELHPELVEAKRLADGTAYLGLADLLEPTPAAVRKAVTDLAKEDLHGIIVDLRGCAGGSFVAAVATSGIFMPPGELVVKWVGRDGVEQREVAAGGKATPEVPVIVLIDHTTMGSCELIAGALKDQLGATLVGQRSRGKWRGHTMEELPNHFAITYTSSHFFPPSGVDLDGKGLAPDVPVAAEVLPASRLLPLAERLPLDPLLQVAHRLLLERNR